MDQIKIGAFLKTLRKEKNLTQEQLAEHMGVSGRTVSRWETGNNMPDISLLVEIAEFYDVSIPVFCNPFLQKVAEQKCRLLQRHFVGCCRASCSPSAEPHKAIASIG